MTCRRSLEKKSHTLSSTILSVVAVTVLTLAAPATAQNSATASTAAGKVGRRKPVTPSVSRLVVIDPTNRTCPPAKSDSSESTARC